MTDTQPTPEAAPDYTLDPAKLTAGSLAYLYGYQPVIVFTDEGDGSIECYRLGDQAFYPASDLSTVRGQRPDALGPDVPQSGDRIAALEDQVRVLTDLLKNQQAAQASSTSTTTATVAAPEPAPVEGAASGGEATSPFTQAPTT